MNIYEQLNKIDDNASLYKESVTKSARVLNNLHEEDTKSRNYFVSKYGYIKGPDEIEKILIRDFPELAETEGTASLLAYHVYRTLDEHRSRYDRYAQDKKDEKPDTTSRNKLAAMFPDDLGHLVTKS